VNIFWKTKLQSKLHTCFKIFAEFETYVGEPRLFAWMDNLVELPSSNVSDMKKLNLLHTGIAAAAKTDGRAGDGLITMADLSDAQMVKLHNHDAYQLAAGTLDPVADVGDVIIVSNYAKVAARDLVITSFEHQLLARRYNEPAIHPHIAVLAGQATDPTALAQPVIAPRERIIMRKIVGTVFAKLKLSIPPKDENAEFLVLSDLSLVHKMLHNAKLFKVSGRSAEPIALDGQYIMTQPVGISAISEMDGRLVIAVDENSVRYFKRLRRNGVLIVLESLNPDGTAPANLLSLNGALGFPKLIQLLEVVGILFEIP
jgi:SOS-response transcriptional repressor LexA